MPKLQVLFHLTSSLLPFFFFFFSCVACGILFPLPGIEPTPSAWEAWSLKHRMAGEVAVLISH